MGKRQPLNTERIKSYYIKFGFDKPVSGRSKNAAHPDPKPVSCSKLGIVTTASILIQDLVTKVRELRRGKSKFFETYSAPIIRFQMFVFHT